ncbi:hypothetical protein B0H14DRAFT_2732841 [Mycena olivaceomarginata]|nr:hypothetical protein B0H14DRAFT_2732841 [Mycena olivaceomarginata]
MISDSHHHHQNVGTAVPPPTTSTVGGIGFTTTTDQLAIHYRHLESLLDSALATLTLINALNHFIAGHPHTPTLIPTTDPTPHPDHGSTPMPMPAPATYATIADPHRSPSPTIPDPNTHKQSPLPKSRPPSPAPSVTSARGQRIVIRFDLNPANRPVQSDLATLYNTVDKALQVDGKPMTYLGGVLWTQRGNLVLFPSTVYDAWHSVVIHGVPMPSDGEPESYDIETMAAFLDYASKFVGAVKAFSILSLSVETDAQWLIENGACFYGARCEVTPYIGRPRGVTPSSNI